MGDCLFRESGEYRDEEVFSLAYFSSLPKLVSLSRDLLNCDDRSFSYDSDFRSVLEYLMKKNIKKG